MRRDNYGPATSLGIFEEIFNWGLKLGALAILVVTGYYVYGIVAASDQLFRGVAQPGQYMTIPEFQKNVQNMQLLMNVLFIASLVVIVSALGRYLPYAETGAVLLIVGVALFFGMPLLIENMGGPAQGLPKHLARVLEPRRFLASQFGFCGMLFLAAGIGDLIVHGVILVASAQNRRPKPTAENAKTASQVRKQQNKFLGPCWELPFCRDTDKKMCPIRNTKRPCWRTGRGCYCDQNIILTLSGGNLYSASRGSSGFLSASATVARPKSWNEKRAQCLGCPVYLHHQSQKYQVMAPLSVIGVIGAIVFYWSTVRNLYPDTMRAVGRALSGFSFGPSPGGVPAWANDLAANPGIMWMLLLVACVLLIAYFLQAVEWILYRLGL